jgi:hypothetical protein
MPPTAAAKSTVSAAEESLPACDVALRDFADSSGVGRCACGGSGLGADDLAGQRFHLGVGA